MPVTNLDVANSALIKLGSRTIGALSDNTVEATSCNARLEPCKRLVLRGHPWNFATKRVKLTLKSITGAANNGSGLIRITCVGHGFSTSDYVTISGIQGTSEANAQWTITKITNDTFDLQGSSFVNTYVSGGYAGLAPAFDYAYKHLLPSDCLRLVLVNEGQETYRVEGRYIISDSETLEIKYVYDVTDYDIMDSLFHEALAYYLAWDICYRISQNAQLRQMMLEGYELVCKRAKFVNAVEEPADILQADDFVEARRNSAQQYVRDPMT